jgi:hypothetical protein
MESFAIEETSAGVLALFSKNAACRWRVALVEHPFREYQLLTHDTLQLGSSSIQIRSNHLEKETCK